MSYVSISRCRNLFLLLPCLLLGTAAEAQYFDFFQQEFFFGWLPSARSEAMGQADIAVGGNVATLFRNPAGIGLIERAEANFSTSGPFFALENSNYYFGGGAWRFHPRFVGAISFNAITVGQSSFQVNIGGDRIPTDKPISSNVTFSVAGEAINNLQIGINANFFRWKYNSDISATNAFYLDLGAIYTIPLEGPDDNPDKGVRIAISTTNLTHSAIAFSGFTDDVSGENNFPVIGRYGVSFFNKHLVSLPGDGRLSGLFTAEFQDLYNSGFRTAFRLGSEITAYDVFAFRLGFYTLSQNDMGISNNVSRVSPLTYGFGLIVPIDQFSKGKWPIKLHVDFTSLNQDERNINSPEFPNMRTFSFRAVWTPQNDNQ